MNPKPSNRFKTPIQRPPFRTPIYGQVWSTKKPLPKGPPQQRPNAKRNLPNSQTSIKQKQFITNVQNDPVQRLCSSLLNLNTFSPEAEDRPTSIYRHNDREFLDSLRNFNEHHQTRSFTFRTTSLARYMRMSREIVDDFVRLKSDEFEKVNPVVAKIDEVAPTNSKTFKKNPQSATMKKRTLRPKSATASRRRTMVNGKSKSNKPESYSDEEIANDNNQNDEIDDEQGLKPLFHRSMDKISSIANWERQIRYELEIEKELQKRELGRQREKLQNDQRKLEDWDKQLRIELDARERKLRLGEEELKSRLEEFNQKTNELMRREQMINEIVSERIKAEMKFEIEKLRKKFNELEIDKSNLTKKEERVKEVEARLHEQVKIVKEKIDSKRMSDIELAKYRKELEITKKENEVLKEKVDSMEDYQVTKFENRAFKNELQVLKENLDSKNQELERDRERWEREQRSSDQKIMSLKRDLRKAEQELMLAKQKYQADNEEISSKLEAANGQVKRLQSFIKDHLAKLNNDFSTTTQTLNHFRQSSLSSNKMTNHHQISHHRGHSLHHSSSSHNYHNRHHHQRSISMDGFNNRQQQQRYSQVRGCRLCNDDENDDDYNNNNKYRNGFNGKDLQSINDFIHDDEEYVGGRLSSCSTFEEQEHKVKHLNISFESEEKRNGQWESNNQESKSSTTKPVNSSEDFVRKIVDQIYEKMANHRGNIEELNELENKNIIENDLIENRQEQNLSNLSNRFEESMNLSGVDRAPAVHQTLYEELLIASELETSKSNKSIENYLPSPNKSSLSLKLMDSQTKLNHSLPTISDNYQLKLHNDTNNNQILQNGEPQQSTQQQNQPPTTSTPQKLSSNDDNMKITSNNNHNRSLPNVVMINNHKNSSDSAASNQSSKSESFEIDW